MLRYLSIFLIHKVQQLTWQNSQYQWVPIRTGWIFLARISLRQDIASGLYKNLIEVFVKCKLGFPNLSSGISVLFLEPLGEVLILSLQWLTSIYLCFWKEWREAWSDIDQHSPCQGITAHYKILPANEQLFLYLTCRHSKFKKWPEIFMMFFPTNWVSLVSGCCLHKEQWT